MNNYDMMQRIDALSQRIQELKSNDSPGNYTNGSLLVGNASGVAADGSGNAFPATPVTGTIFFRSDLGFLCYYDGTRWLTCHEFQAALFRVVFTVTASTEIIAPLYKQYAPYITRVALETFVATTNNATNFWTVTIRGANDAYGSFTTIHAFTTAAHTVNTWTHTESAAMSGTPTPSNLSLIDVKADKTLTPGNISIAASVYYRLIVT